MTPAAVPPCAVEKTRACQQECDGGVENGDRDSDGDDAGEDTSSTFSYESAERIVRFE
jgi:hypothetical protein